MLLSIQFLRLCRKSEDENRNKLSLECILDSHIFALIKLKENNNQGNNCAKVFPQRHAGMPGYYFLLTQK